MKKNFPAVLNEKRTRALKSAPFTPEDFTEDNLFAREILKQGVEIQ
ncbi:MAG: hypothetical protein HZA01_16775 [Nitrospinae bacterium]|nr:hypothetical protein [Nitrospinota bacterium]